MEELPQGGTSMKTIRWLICIFLTLQVFYGIGASTASTYSSDQLVQYEKEYIEAGERYEDFAVKSLEEFIRMKEYLAEFREDGVIVHEFLMSDGSECVCVDVYTQGSLAAAGISPDELTFQPLMPPAPRPEPIEPPGKESTMPASEHVGPMLDGSLDPNGNIRRCPDKSFPRLIPSEEALFRFRDLESFWSKYPGDGESKVEFIASGSVSSAAEAHGKRKDSVVVSGGRGLPAPPAVVHKYAAARLITSNIGQGGDFNLWSPEVEDDDEFSLCQLWEVNGAGADTQTVELGWQVYEGKYGNDKARLFIYYTTCNYAQHGDGFGCYNLDCEGFIQTDPDVVIGGYWNNYSQVNGTQYHVTLEAYRDPPSGHWWLRYGGSIWIGYYPTTLFDHNGLKLESIVVNMGGEVVDNGVDHPSTTDMGSGKFAGMQYAQAAFVKHMHYWTSDAYHDARGMDEIQTHDQLYTTRLGSASDNVWGYYLYYGGPGAIAEDPQLSLYYYNHDPLDCFAPDDLFDGRYYIQNPSTTSIALDLYIALEVEGNFFFWPSWGQDLDFQNMTVPGSGGRSESFMRFGWPGGTSSFGDLFFWGVMTTPGTFEVLGDVAVLPVCALGSGNISFQLNWDYYNSGEGPDLDLHVVSPNGYHIYYGVKTSPDGGRLDFDDRGACGEGSGGGPENIFWEAGTAPRGTYEYYVKWYASCGDYDSASYLLQVRVEGSLVRAESGSIGPNGAAYYSYTY